VKYLHWEFNTTGTAVVEVQLDRGANVLLFDSHNYSLYRRGSDYRYRGGLAKVSPSHLTIPHAGSWHVVVDLGGYGGRVTASAVLMS
jgi:hypothetical protein